MKINMTEQDAFEAFHEKMRGLGETLILEGRLPGHPTRVVWQTAIEVLGLEFESVPSKRPQAKRLATSHQHLGNGQSVPLLVDEESGDPATNQEYQEAAYAYNSTLAHQDALYDSAAGATPDRPSTPFYPLYGSSLDEQGIGRRTWRGEYANLENAVAAAERSNYEWYKIFEVSSRVVKTSTSHPPSQPITQEDVDAAFGEHVDEWEL